MTVSKSLLAIGGFLLVPSLAPAQTFDQSVAEAVGTFPSAYGSGLAFWPLATTSPVPQARIPSKVLDDFTQWHLQTIRPAFRSSGIRQIALGYWGVGEWCDALGARYSASGHSIQVLETTGGAGYLAAPTRLHLR